MITPIIATQPRRLPGCSIARHPGYVAKRRFDSGACFRCMRMFSPRAYLESLRGFFSPNRRIQHRTIYRLSSAGVAVPDAVKQHNANMRFKTREAADRNRAHPLDLSHIVPIKVSVQEYRRLFARRREVADLRQLRDIKATRLRVR